MCGWYGRCGRTLTYIICLCCRSPCLTGSAKMENPWPHPPRRLLSSLAPSLVDPPWNLGSLLTGHAVLGHPDPELANVTTKHRPWAGPSATLATLGSTWPSASRTSSGLAQDGRLKPKGLDWNVTFAQDDWLGSARYHGRPIGQWVAWFSPELPWPSTQRVDDCVGCSTREVSAPAHPIAASARQDDRSLRTRPDESRKWASPGTRIHPAES